MTDALDDALASSFPIDTTGTSRRGTEWLTTPGQLYFGVVASRMRKLGWAVLPQDRDGRRLPSIIAGERIKWKQYQTTPPTQEVTDRWCTLAPTANAAILLGEVSGNTICLDLDITDFDLSLQIQEIAEEILGLSPFRRVGKRPKMALFYRMEAAELPRSAVYYLMEADGQTRSDHMIELQTSGKMMTVYGPHHETGDMLKWRADLPWHVGPEAAPLITPDQLQAFLDAVEAVRAFHRNAGGADVTFDYVDADGIDLPRVRSAGGAWVEDADGFVEGGREKYIFSIAMRTVRSNPSACIDERGIAKLKKAIFDEALRTMRTTGKWSEAHIRSDVSEKVSRFAAQVAAGTLSPIVRETTVLPTDELSKQISKGKNKICGSDETFAWLPAGRKLISLGFTKASEDYKQAWALKSDRSSIHAMVAGTIRSGLDHFFDDIRLQRKNGAVYLVKAPTGAGKTDHTLKRILRDPDAIADGSLPLDQRRGPLLFLMPTYNNISEIRDRALAMGLDPEMSDAELESAAAERGVVFEGEVDKEIERLRGLAEGSPVRTMVYRGKKAAGCAFPERMQMLIDADIGSSGMCKSTIKNQDGEREDSFCVHYSTCEAIKQRAEIANAHVVFMARAFLTLTIPEELKTVRGVIIDEAIWDMLAHTNVFPIAALRGTRPNPSQTKAEKEAGVNPHELVERRGEVADLVIKALESGKDPALHIRDKRPINCLELVRDAMRVCSSAIQNGQTVRPGMADHDFLDLIAQPKSNHVKAEHRLWSLVLERLETIVLDELSGREPRRDTRIQFIRHDDAEPVVRLSWRTEPNWAEVPVLLLDASGNRLILERVFGGREIKVFECENDPNLRAIAFPDRSMAVTKLLGRAGQDELETAKALLAIRRMITAICAAHSIGRVIIATTKPVRQIICAEWVPPANADFMHDGATAGLDFAKSHVAAISLGRTELPITTVDGLVAALTYDLPEPEMPIDYLGTGKDLQDNPLQPRKVGRKTRMRDGRHLITQHQAHAGTYARAVQEQAREEAIRQRVGRLRGVYRDDPAAVYLIGEAMPDDVVLDDIRSYADMETGFGLLDIARRCDGILCADMIAKLAPDQYTVGAAQKDIDKLSPHLLKSYRWIGYATDAGEQKLAHVPIHFDDFADERTFVKWAKALKLPHGQVNKGEQLIATVPPHAPRPHDQIEESLGTVEERREEEESFRRRIFESAMSLGEYRPASMAPIGKQPALYRVHPHEPEKAEIGAIHLMRLIKGITDVPADTGIEANAIAMETSDDFSLGACISATIQKAGKVSPLIATVVPKEVLQAAKTPCLRREINRRL
ncbi:bifunctional DNA primase/polymerase [Devosia salina]|uniref:Bifunctional DNA primase/polymerase n=1 Tax=Devosia salina TaxID=2860336 RepID=A0ABX8WB44_9HYPH|nr:bifunctional DNA primase/polymerase [Devosia salina]QYO75663.1 bifunctional DNA primase/polymerase [Devosia salina]